MTLAIVFVYRRESRKEYYQALKAEKLMKKNQEQLAIKDAYLEGRLQSFTFLKYPIIYSLKVWFTTTFSFYFSVSAQRLKQLTIYPIGQSTSNGGAPSNSTPLLKKIPLNRSPTNNFLSASTGFREPFKDDVSYCFFFLVMCNSFNTDYISFQISCREV